MKSLAYETIFGKKYTHEQALKKEVIDGIVHIIMNERSISEKDFTRYDEVIKEVSEKINEDILKRAEQHYQSEKRMSLFYETIYDELWKQTTVLEKKIWNFEKFVIENKSSIGDDRSIEDKIKFLKKIPKELKDDALNYISFSTKAINSKITGLRLHPLLVRKIKEKELPSGFSMGIDKNGYFIHTHRARSKSYASPKDITVKEIKFIDSTG